MHSLEEFNHLMSITHHFLFWTLINFNYSVLKQNAKN